jgi:hypothetical protein
VRCLTEVSDRIWTAEWDGSIAIRSVCGFQPAHYYPITHSADIYDECLD